MKALKIELQRDIREAKKRKGRLLDQQKQIGNQITLLRKRYAFTKDLKLGFLHWAIATLGFEKVELLAAGNMSAFLLRSAIQKLTNPNNAKPSRTAGL